MLNMIWAGMLLSGILYGALTGNITAVSGALLEYTESAVSLCITMAGVMALWVGLMEIATSAGMLEKLTKMLQPMIRFLFPDIPRNHPSLQYIATNIAANLMGLGWACTPAGLKAMEKLGELNHHDERASDAMCGFLVLNISSLQLIPVNMIAYRSKFGSVNPTAIILPAILATLISTLVGILFIKTAYGRRKRG